MSAPTPSDDLTRAIEGAALPEGFLLTDYTRLKGCSCKVPQDRLLALLRTAASVRPGQDVGLDCSIVELKSKTARRLMAGGEKLFMVSTTDFFFPSVEDPYVQGQIGAANVLSDLFAMGIVDCDNVLMLLGASTDMEENERDAVTRDMMRGFIDKCKEAGTEVTGGQSVMNPWPLIGGVAMSVVAESEMVRPTRMVPGDVLVLTKPLGTQVAVNLRQWTRRPSPLYKRCVESHMSADEIDALYHAACNSMAQLNLNAASLMIKHGAHACTDVTGFGILGHSRNLASSQDVPTRIVLDRLPILAGAVKGDGLLAGKYRLLQGLSAETSGGLLVAFPGRAAADAFATALKEEYQQTSWVVGRVEAREDGPLSDAAVITEDVEIVHVEAWPC
jgi:selenide,water dikinase